MMRSCVVGVSIAGMKATRILSFMRAATLSKCPCSEINSRLHVQRTDGTIVQARRVVSPPIVAHDSPDSQSPGLLKLHRRWQRPLGLSIPPAMSPAAGRQSSPGPQLEASAGSHTFRQRPTTRPSFKSPSHPLPEGQPPGRQLPGLTAKQLRGPESFISRQTG